MHVDSGHLRPEVPSGQDKVQEAVEGGEQHAHRCLCTPEQHGSAEAGRCKRACWANSRKSPKRIAQTDLIAGDFNSSAYRERGKAGVSFIEETWEETMLLPPSGAVPMWGRMKETEDCCGFIITKKNEPSWRVAGHGSFQLNKVKLQIGKQNKQRTSRLHTPLRSANS